MKPETLDEMTWLYDQMKLTLATTVDPGDRVALLSAMTDLAVGLANAEAARELAATFEIPETQDDELPPIWARGGNG